MTMNPVTPTVSQLEYNTRMRVANALAKAGEALGFPLARLDIESIVDAARRQTGLRDYGDPSFLEPMAKIIELVRANQEFTPLARVILRQSWIRAVANRLQLEDWVARHPDALARRVERPIFVLGFPSTGTTLLQNLLAQEPGRRGLPFWELALPVPVSEDPGVDRESRRSTARMMLSAAYQAAPEMAAVHFIEVDTLEECWPLFANSFAVMNWELQSGLEEYGDWLMKSWNMHQPYAEYGRYLQVLVDQDRRAREAVGAAPAGQLVLKCPEHLWFVDTLLDTFPDACVVWTHRDPYDTIASYCSLMSLQWRTLFGRIDRPAIGDFMQRRLLVGIERALEARKHLDPGRFFDAKFEDLVADPRALIRRMSDHFGLEIDPGLDERITGYLSRKRADERGSHKYDGRLYGLDREVVYDEYRNYIETIGVAIKQ